MPTRKSWTAEEEMRLKDLVECGCPLDQIAARMMRTQESVRQKMRKLGLKESERALESSVSLEKSRSSQGLPSVMEVTKDLWDAAQSLKQPGLSPAEVQRLRTEVQALKAVKESLVELAQYREIEDEIDEDRAKYGKEIEKETKKSKKGSSDEPGSRRSA